MRFVLDSMLGRLAKWLRAMGCDVCYRARYHEGVLDRCIQKGRVLVSRDRARTDRFPGAVLVQAHHVGEQIRELRDRTGLDPDPRGWFSRCLVCNEKLRDASAEEARENVPEYVFFENRDAIRFCPSCGRYFWPGTHRERMLAQLRDWGFDPGPERKAGSWRI